MKNETGNRKQEKKTINIRTIYCRKQIFTKELPVLDIQLCIGSPMRDIPYNHMDILRLPFDILLLYQHTN